MHELRDVIKSKWGEVYLRDNPKDSDDEDLFASSRRRQNEASTSTATTTQQETSTSTSTTTTTTAVVTATTAATTTASRLGSEPNTSVPTAPHPSDQVTPSSRSPQDTSSTVDQLRSSLRQVADALAETVAAVRSTREQLLVREEEGTAGESSTQETSVEAMETREELETIPEGQVTVQEVPTLMDSHPDTQSTSVTSQSPRSIAASTDTSALPSLTSQDISTASGPTTTTTSSSSAHPIMATFDGSQESAVATLASTNPEDPLYTFLSAVARTPAPPISDSPATTSTTLPSQTPPTSESSSGVVSPRLPVFAQFQDQSSSGDETTSFSSTTEQTPSATQPITQSAIRTSVIQHPRSTTSTLSSAVSNRTGTNVPPTQRGTMLLQDVVGMEQQTQAALTTEVVNSTSELPDVASQVSSFFSQNPNQSMDQDPTRVTTVSLDSQLLPTTSSQAPNAIDLTSQMQVSTSSPPSGSQRQSLQSPSPSDTLAPLLISSLQLPSSSSTTVTSTPPTITLSSVIHDHPHLSTAQASAVTTTTAGSTNLSPVVSTPTTGGEAGPSMPLSISTRSVPSTGAIVPQQGEGRLQSTDSQQTPETNSIDPTFLAALPHSIRQEVLAQHRREQRAQQPTQEEEEPAAPFQSSISPEFLAALPLNIQNEVSFVRLCVKFVLFSFCTVYVCRAFGSIHQFSFMDVNVVNCWLNTIV